MKILTLIILLFYSLHAYDVYIDKTGSLTLQEILAKKKQFLPRDDLHFGLTNDTIWIKQHLENSTNSSQEYSMWLSFMLESIYFYEKSTNGYIVEKSGYQTPLHERAWRSRHNLYSTHLKVNESKEIYIKVYSHTSIMITLKVFDNLNSFYQFTLLNDNISIAFLAIIIAFLLYNGLIYLFTKERVYLFYTLYQFFYILFQLHYTNYTTMITGVGKYFYISFNLSLTLFMIFLLLFFKEILEIKTLSPLLNKIMSFIISIFMLSLLLAFVYQPFLIVLRNSILMPFGLLSITFSLLFGIYKRSPFSLYLLLGWIGFFCSTFYTAQHFSFGLTQNIFSLHSMLISAAVEMIIFSIILALRLRSLKNEIDDKNNLLQLKSKEAQMGEMIGMISHQWTQPLSIISAGATSSLIKLELGDFKYEKIKIYLENTINNVTFLSETINEFRTFFRTEKVPQIMNIHKPIDKALKILEGTLDINKVQIEISFLSKKETSIFSNGMTQVILNIVKNADDNFLEKRTLHPKIWISTIDTKESIQIKICDNGGGVSEYIIETIFEQSFSTKDEKLGTGLGLYMSRRIIKEQHRGKLYAKNKGAGLCFIIELPFVPHFKYNN